jgi:hypothetical protein
VTLFRIAKRWPLAFYQFADGLFGTSEASSGTLEKEISGRNVRIRHFQKLMRVYQMVTGVFAMSSRRFLPILALTRGGPSDRP